MFRLSSNQHVSALTRSDPSTYATQCEPQLMFRAGVTERFEPLLPYGMGPKVEMLLRLGVPGPWDEWPGATFRKLRDLASRKSSRLRGTVRDAGFVLRLAPGNARTATDLRYRQFQRNEGIKRIVARLDKRLGETS